MNAYIRIYTSSFRRKSCNIILLSRKFSKCFIIHACTCMNICKHLYIIIKGKKKNYNAVNNNKTNSKNKIVNTST